PTTNLVSALRLLFPNGCFLLSCIHNIVDKLDAATPNALAIAKSVNEQESWFEKSYWFATLGGPGRGSAQVVVPKSLVATWDPTPPFALICSTGCRALRSNPPPLKLRRAGLGSRRRARSTPSRTSPLYRREQVT